MKIFQKIFNRHKKLKNCDIFLSQNFKSRMEKTSRESLITNVDPLPIDSYRNLIIEKIKHERVVIIHGETG